MADISSIDSKLPYGDQLKSLLIQNEITEGFIQKALKSRGIFFGLKNKEHTIPILCAGILSPSEYEKIKNQKVAKEDNIKRKSEILTWNSTKSLLDEVPQIKITDAYKPEYDNFEFVGDPTFFPVAGNHNHLVYEYEIESYNLNDSWSEKKKTFQGSIEIKLINGNVDLVAISNHTSKDTDKINKGLIKSLKSDLAAKGLTSNKEEKLTFDFFTNEERINFFWSQTGAIKSNILTFKKITDIDIKTDEFKSIPSNLDISWMDKKISKIHLNGEDVQSTFFIKDVKCHPYLLMWKMQAHFSFTGVAAAGQCKVNFEFYNYPRSSNPKAEFGIDISSIEPETKYSHISKLKIKKLLLEELDTLKIDLFRSIINSKSHKKP